MDNFNFIKKVPITKGWSGDKKYCVTREDGTKLLLRVSPMEQYETKKAEFEMMQRVAALDVPMCLPVEFGTCENNGNTAVYSLQSWIDGEDAEEKVPFLPDTEQYLYGIQAGEILRKIHSIPAPETSAGGVDTKNWENQYNAKIDRKINAYRDCTVKFSGADKMIGYIHSNRHLLHARPFTLQHGDYHRGNMMVDNRGKLTIIDFGRAEFGDPWEDIKAITWDVQMSPSFASGRINGYFNGEIPIDFWRLLALYICVGTLASITWAIPFGQKEVNTMLSMGKDVLDWYDGMKNPVPKWYFAGYYILEREERQ